MKPTRQIDCDGSISFYLNDLLHREDGPAVEYTNGTKIWHLNGLCHREGGPAVEYPNGSKEWWLNNLRHREDGPAVECTNGYKLYFLHGEEIFCKDNEEFLIMIKLKIFW